VTVVTLTIWGYVIVDMRMMRELARQISGIDAIPASGTASRPNSTAAGHAAEEPPQREVVLGAQLRRQDKAALG
jgi:hypothetical protein